MENCKKIEKIEGHQILEDRNSTLVDKILQASEYISKKINENNLATWVVITPKKAKKLLRFERQMLRKIKIIKNHGNSKI